MAKQSVFAKNAKRKKTVQKYAEKRKRLLEIAKDPKASYEDQLEARQELAKLPVNANPNRVVNRCEVTGRPRGYLRHFGLVPHHLPRDGPQGHAPRRPQGKLVAYNSIL